MMSPLLVSAMLLHALSPGDGDIPAPGDVWAWHHWTLDITITLPLLLSGIWYLGGSLRRGQHPSLRWRHVSFWAGWAALSVALISPLHRLGDALFSAHMLQHEILILIAAPLIAASHCSVTLLYMLPRKWRPNVGHAVLRLERSWFAGWIIAPLPAWILHAVALWGWHMPALYQASVRSDAVHALQHLSFFLSAVVFWSALYGAGRSHMSSGAGVMYTFGTAVHCSALGALLTFSTVLWYPIYAQRTFVWGLTPLQDQQLGGLLMWVPSGLIFISIGMALMARWISSSSDRSAHSALHDRPLYQEGTR